MIGASLRPRQRPTSLYPNMPPHSRVYSKDEELGKRDDDFKPSRPASMSASAVFKPWRWRKRRLLTVIAVVFLVYVLINTIPADLGPLDQWLASVLRPGHKVQALVSQSGPQGAPPRPMTAGESQEDQYYYDGPVKFYKLAVTLRGSARTMGSKSVNRNVLFAVSSLRSAANLIPMACEMARWDRNYVHMAFLGRDPLPLEDVLEINGVKKGDCTVFFHDGRSDYSEYSTDTRGEVAVAGAMKHINEFMHPQAIIMDDSTVEDRFFARAMRNKAKELGRALIEVPAGRYEQFFWMTRLDSGSLASWFKPSIDVLVHALPGSSGGLLRLVKSLGNADYSGLRVPRLTIELPTDVEPFAKRYFEWLEWPPTGDPSPIGESTLALRHRIPVSHVSSEQASTRFLESFYPARTQDNHVLILSPQAELSPIFAQYLQYAILEYRYSSYGSSASESLLGISLDVPTTFLNGAGGFSPPLISDMNGQKYTNAQDFDQGMTAPFLYHAPSATASLIFGDKWVTLHDFLSKRIVSSHVGKAPKTKKLVSEMEPSWLEYLLELMRARGWNMLHPPTSFITAHNELSQIPEEYMRDTPESQKGAEVLERSDHPEEEPYLTAREPPALTEHVEREQPGLQPLHEILPLEGDLPELSHLPYLSYTGDLINVTSASDMQKEYVTFFRQHIGGCEGADVTRQRPVHTLKTDDLFCLPGMDLESNLDIEEKEAEVVEATAHSTVVEKPVKRKGALTEEMLTVTVTETAEETDVATVETQEEKEVEKTKDEG